MTFSKRKVALFHPWIKSRGGAERVILELLKKSQHKIDLYTWIYDQKNTFDEFKNYNIKIIAPKIFQKLGRFRIARGLFLGLCFVNRLPLNKYDKFLISTSGVAEFITFSNYKKGNTLAYVHTPLREANDKIIKWNLDNKGEGFLGKKTYILTTKIYKFFERLSWKKLDVVIFNSKTSLLRAQNHCLIKNKKTYIIPPPVKLNKPKKIVCAKKDTFVYISRINPPKRQDVVLKAWGEFIKKHKSYKLILIGKLENKEYSKKIKMLVKKTKNVTLMGGVKNDVKEKVISECRAGLFFGYQEDFGLIPLEIISAGKPLIATDEGGYIEVISGNPLFHKVKEKHSNLEMAKEIEKELELFLHKKQIKPSHKLNMGNFIKDVDEILSQ